MVDLNRLRENLKKSKPVQVRKDGTVENGSNGRSTLEPGRFA